MGIGNLGLTELVLLVVLVLIFFGPQRLPEVARGVGRAMRQFKKGLNEVQREFEEMERRQGERSSEEERARSRTSRPAAGESVEPPKGRPEDGVPTFGGERDEAGGDAPSGGSGESGDDTGSGESGQSGESDRSGTPPEAGPADREDDGRDRR